MQSQPLCVLGSFLFKFSPLQSVGFTSPVTACCTPGTPLQTPHLGGSGGGCVMLVMVVLSSHQVMSDATPVVLI